ncbi:MAG: hypothetical protein RTU30_03460 [Candidatus Thorarchaeota archaeon]
MTNNPEKIIEQYLERVRIYLPLDSADTLMEIRTHLLDSAEEIGQGAVTAGSVTMAIERLGDPKRVAHEYAGTGETKGPVPAEYVQPVMRVLLTILALSIAIIVGVNIIGAAFGGTFGSQNFPFNIPVIIALNVLIVVGIVVIVSLVVDRDKAVTEKTTLEAVLGAGGEGFKPKGRWDAAGEAIFGMIAAYVIIIPAVQYALVDDIVPLMNIGALLLMLGAIKGALFFRAGENNLNLLFEALISVGLIILGILFAGFLIPMDYIYVFNDGVWHSYSMSQLIGLVPIDEFDITIVFAIGWSICIFILIVTNVWKVLVSTAKISMHLKDGKGWWWQGMWGTPRYRKLRRRFWQREAPTPTPSDGRTYQDGYQD